MAGSLAPVMYWALRLTVRCRAVAIPGGEATGQDALDGAAVEPFEDLGTHAKSFLLRGKRFCRALFMTVLVCLDHDSSLVMWTPRNLKLSTRSTTAPPMYPNYRDSYTLSFKSLVSLRKVLVFERKAHFWSIRITSN